MGQRSEFASRSRTSSTDAATWVELLPLLESLCAERGGYDLIKFGGERAHKRFTVVFSLPRPRDIVRRCDVDSMDEGVRALCQELQAMDLVR